MKCYGIVVLAGLLLTGSQAAAPQLARAGVNSRIGSGPAEAMRLPDAPHHFGRSQRRQRRLS